MSEFLQTLADLQGMSEIWLMSGFIVFLRVGAAMAALPAFGEQVIPMRVRLALALAFTFIVAPPVAETVAPLAGPGRVIGAFVLTETVIGLAIGLVLRMFVFALSTAGAIIAQTISLSQLFGGASPEPQPVISNILVMTGLALALMAGLHVRLAEILILSYDIVPPGALPAAADMAAWGLGWVSAAFALAFMLAAPFAIASVLYNVALGAINRAMPSLMVAFIGAPALVLGGITLFAILASVLLTVWMQSFVGFLDNPFAVPQ